MTVKHIHDAASGSCVKFGRRRPVAHGPRMSLKNYLTRSLPPPPPTADYTEKAKSVLDKMYENNKLGDCVIAGMAHIVGTLTANVGQPTIYSNEQIVALYSAIGGYVPGQGNTDQGCDEVTALNYWENNGATAGGRAGPAEAHRIAGYLAVDATDPVEVRTALYLFENLFFGMELPDKWLADYSPHAPIVWDVAGPSNPDNGHCVVGVGYTPTGVAISTWGRVGTITDAAIAEYATKAAGGGLYTVVSQDALSTISGRAPTGLDWSQLVADFDSMGGTVSSSRLASVR
jgi:hypothetical protein